MSSAFALAHAEEFRKLIDPSLLSHPDMNLVVLQRPQLFPSLYLKHYDTFIAKYAMGSGKTLAALMVMEPYIEQFYDTYEAIRQRGEVVRMKKRLDPKLPRKPVFIGPWSARNSLFSDIQKTSVWRRRLGKISPGEKRDKINIMWYVLNFVTHKDFAASYSKRDAGDEARKNASYYEAILDSPTGRDEVFYNNLQDNILVIDEIQNAYSSSNGLNSLGVALRDVHNEILEGRLKCKVMYLSWTPFSSSIAEAWYFSDILSGGRLSRETRIEDYVTTTSEGPYTVYKLKDDKVSEIAEYFSTNFAEYYPTSEEKTVEIMYFGKPFVAKEEQSKIVAVKMSPEQWEQYSAIQDTIGEETLSVDLKNKRAYSGEFIGTESKTRFLENIESNSAVASFLVSRLKDQALKRKGKSLVYHGRIKTGLYVYSDLLQAMGFAMGENTVRNGLCWKCFERKNKCECDEFTQARFMILTGMVKDTERRSILENFNHDDNLYGDMYGVLLISNVGEVGLSLVGVRNVFQMAIPRSIKSQSQIIARAARFQSHIKLPPVERNVTSYQLIPVGPNGEETRYIQLLKAKYLNEKYIADFEAILSQQSVLRVTYENAKMRSKYKLPKSLQFESFNRYFATKIYSYGSEMIRHVVTKICRRLPRTDAIGLLKSGKITAVPWSLEGIDTKTSNMIIDNMVASGVVYQMSVRGIDVLVPLSTSLDDSPRRIEFMQYDIKEQQETMTEKQMEDLIETLSSARRIGPAFSKIKKTIYKCGRLCSDDIFISLLKYDHETGMRLRRITDPFLLTYYNGDEEATGHEYLSRRYLNRSLVTAEDRITYEEELSSTPDGFIYGGRIYTLGQSGWDDRPVPNIIVSKKLDTFMMIARPDLGQKGVIAISIASTVGGTYTNRTTDSFDVSKLVEIYKEVTGRSEDDDARDGVTKLTVDYIVSVLLQHSRAESRTNPDIFVSPYETVNL